MTPDYYQTEYGDLYDEIAKEDSLPIAVSFALGNAKKYLKRLGKKDDIQQEPTKAETCYRRAKELVETHKPGNQSVTTWWSRQARLTKMSHETYNQLQKAKKEHSHSESGQVSGGCVSWEGVL
jgi:hypothetical protein